MNTILFRHIRAILWVATLSGSTMGCSMLQAVTKQIDKSPQFKHTHTGLVVLDPERGKYVVEYKPDHLFTPASNTKLWTVYAAMHILDDSIPSVAVCRNAGRVYIRGLGDPTFLHPAFPEQPVFEHLRSLDAPLTLVSNDSSPDRYAPGWAWDDYPYYFQPERSAMPIYGNALRLRQGRDSVIHIVPSQMAPLVTVVCDTSVTGTEATREEFRNQFGLRYNCSMPLSPTDIPFRTSDSLLHVLLTDTLHPEKPLMMSRDADHCHHWDTLYNVPADTLYKRILVHSDNFLAEQLLLGCALSSAGVSTGSALIDSTMAQHFPGYTDGVHWADGSGLSRYNQFTPRSMVDLLCKMYQNAPLDRLFHILPAGGKSGTLRNAFVADPPYVYAKSGSMRNIYNLSGFLRTDSGKILIFSFMNNHLQQPFEEVKRSMASVLETIAKNYR